MKKLIQKLVLRIIDILDLRNEYIEMILDDEAGDPRKIKFEKAILKVFKQFNLGGDLKRIQAFEIKAKCGRNNYPTVSISKYIF